MDLGAGVIELEVFENGVPPRFRLRLPDGLHCMLLTSPLKP
jgi:hypothetical protein